MKEYLSRICYKDTAGSDTFPHYKCQNHSLLFHNAKTRISCSTIRINRWMHQWICMSSFVYHFAIPIRASTGNVMYLLANIDYLLLSIMYLLFHIMQLIPLYGIHTISPYRYFYNKFLFLSLRMIYIIFVNITIFDEIELHFH
jgi:hypothetical protein